jgi:ABC-type nickel/cobalt efflux system permease component RcnA
MGRRSLRIGLLLASALSTVAFPAVATAHPLGNFTINHYAGLAISPSGIDLDVVIDMAEIPAFQERQRIDTDGDGEVADAETAAAASDSCTRQAASLAVAVGGSEIPLAASASTISFPAGLGGLSTMRLECRFHASVAFAAGAATDITFADTSYPERIGWREIVATATDGATLTTNGLPTTSPSNRLTAYPADLISQPLDIRSAAISVVVAPAAVPHAPAASTAAPAPAAIGGAVPGGIGAELPGIFRAIDLTPVVLIVSLLTAVALGAGHALTPGHGKTLMAAYLVGSRGRPLHAVGLGLAVSVSHTLGIVVLAALVVGAQGALPPDVVVRVAPVVAAVAILAIGGWMLIGEVRRRWRRAASGHVHPHSHNDDPELEHGQSGRAHAHGGMSHSHGGVSHSHASPEGATLTWRGLFALGLAGGLIPSTSALFILLGSIVAGRPAFGFVLVVAFGLGMALVMTAVGLAMVFARGRLERLPTRSRLGRLALHAPLVAAVVVLAFGVYLTAQAIGGRPVL